MNDAARSCIHHTCQGKELRRLRNRTSLRSVPKCAPKRQLCALRNANYAICVPMFAHSAFRRALRNANRVSQEIGAIRAPRMAVWRGGLGQWHVWQSRKVRPRGREENTAMRYAARGRRPKPRIACITRHTRPSRRRTVARWQIHDWQPAVAPRSSRPIRTIWSSASNAVLEALRVGVPSMQLYIATRIEHDDRTREIIKLAGAQSLHLLEADRLEMDRTRPVVEPSGRRAQSAAVPVFVSRRAGGYRRAQGQGHGRGEFAECAHQRTPAVHRARRRDRPAEPGCGDWYRPPPSVPTA